MTILSTPAADLLATLARQSFDLLHDGCHPVTGMVLDRVRNFEARDMHNRMSSIASTGYYLSLLPYAEQQGWLKANQAAPIAARILRFAAEHLDHHYGLFYHFIDWETGQRWAQSEFSLLDTAILLNGAIVAAVAFPELAVEVDSLLDRVEWPRFLRTHPATGKELLSFGWSPDDGGRLLYPADVRSSELAMPYFLAAGSRTHPIAPTVWYNTAAVWGEVCGHHILNPGHALFTSYYGLGWMDLRDLRDQEGIDFHQNARKAALANRAYCRTTAAARFATYRPAHGGWWGLSAGDSPAGYVARGPVEGDPDGTVWPMTALAAICWVPEVLIEDLTHWQKSAEWTRIRGQYGLAPFSLDNHWVGDDLIGIDVGSYAINWANYTKQAIWKLWMRHSVSQLAIERLGYTQ